MFVQYLNTMLNLLKDYEAFNKKAMKQRKLKASEISGFNKIRNKISRIQNLNTCLRVDLYVKSKQNKNSQLGTSAQSVQPC